MFPNGLIAFAFGYLLGSIPFGMILTRIAGTQDLRSIGSGNIGATNVLRTGRKGLAAATLAFDLVKGFLPVLVAHRWYGLDAALAAGLGAVVGHCFPVWLGFRGGKGVATASGVVLALSWVILAVCLALFVVVFAATRIVSTASLTAAVAAPLLAWWLGEPRMAVVLLIIGIIVWAKHAENIGRLMRGEENRFNIGSRKG